jgi:hypothetical protein
MPTSMIDPSINRLDSSAPIVIRWAVRQLCGYIVTVGIDEDNFDFFNYNRRALRMESSDVV